MADSIPSETRKDKQCPICSRRFARSEHLTRHRLTHTKEKPYPCTLCNRSFQRADVRALHVRKCRGVSTDQSTGDNGLSSSPRKRVRLACNRCRQKKIACNGQEPCSQCRNAPVDCEYAGSRDAHEDPPDEDVPDATARSFSGDQSIGASSTAPLPSGSVDDSLNADNFAFDQGTHQVSFLPATEKEMPAMLHEGAVPDELELALNTGDLLDPITMNEIWQIPPLDSQFWLDGSDLSWSEGQFDTTFLMPDYSASSASQQRITGMMQDYFDRKSRKSSPSAPDKASVMWYSAPPNLDDHDKDVLNVFVNLFHKHVSETFTLFKEIDVPRKTRPEFTLAMAATGGLFCSVAGSADVAKSMYNDSRRLLLASHHRKMDTGEDKSNRRDKLLAACTFILLQLYGLCSGDKRSYEFVEAFYGDLIHAVKDYSRSCAGPGDAVQQNEDVLLLESLYILDCYRVILMYRPPCFPWRHTNSFAHTASPDDRMTDLLGYPAALTDIDQPSDINNNGKNSLSTLGSLSGYLWPATSLSESIGLPNDPNREVSQNPSLWKSDFVEMACNTWLRSQKEVPLPTLVVYHHINTMLHANLVLLQRFAHSSPTSAARDPQKGAIAKAICSWIHGRDYEIAHWHADQLIASLELAVVASKSTAGHPGSRPTVLPSYPPPEAARLTFEAPHTPYAVYYASLVLWCGELTGDPSNSTAAAAKAHLVRGEMILSAHKARIAQLLARVLIEIK
ncbi:hypothetical protein PV04_10390 [Phialophora macrospora]|uniref:Zn(2)-C6 fungal-type domain-containing protein n=1 Tax=Phialophora macrospora TaxID=1851006 RepID=A0A0D2DIK7_9EURO|nr:hypothetical protein PV04_10390 [Phialophora macrospora]